MQKRAIAGSEEVFGSFGARREFCAERFGHDAHFALLPILYGRQCSAELAELGGACGAPDVLPDLLGRGEPHGSELLCLVILLDARPWDVVDGEGYLGGFERMVPSLARDQK